MKQGKGMLECWNSGMLRDLIQIYNNLISLRACEQLITFAKRTNFHLISPSSRAPRYNRHFVPPTRGPGNGGYNYQMITELQPNFAPAGSKFRGVSRKLLFSYNALMLETTE